MMKGKFHQEYIMIINVHAPNNRTHKYVNKKLTELRKNTKLRNNRELNISVMVFPKMPDGPLPINSYG